MGIKKMKIFISILLASTSAIKLHYDKDFMTLLSGAPSLNDEFKARKAELLEAKENRLETAWQARIDNYDPDLDQDMATDIINAHKAHKQKAILENKLKNMSGFDPDYDAVKGMVKTLRE